MNLQRRRKVQLLHLGQDVRYLLAPPIYTTHTAKLLDREWEGLSVCQDTRYFCTAAANLACRLMIYSLQWYYQI